jgi:hypothetical protein
MHVTVVPGGQRVLDCRATMSGPRLPGGLEHRGRSVSGPGRERAAEVPERGGLAGNIEHEEDPMPVGETGHPSLRDEAVADARGLKDTERRRRLDVANPYRHPGEAGVAPTLRTPYSEALDRVKVTNPDGSLNAAKVRRSSK